MTTEQQIQAINSLCLSGESRTLHRILNELPGSLAILLSDKPAEAKRQELLKLLKEGSNR